MTGEKVPVEEDGEMHAGEEKYHQVSLPHGPGVDRHEEDYRSIRKIGCLEIDPCRQSRCDIVFQDPILVLHRGAGEPNITEDLTDMRLVCLRLNIHADIVAVSSSAGNA
jgi:hypothetical protein